MILEFGKINLLAIAAATLALFVLGGLWFALIFAKQYRFALGKENQPQEKPAPIYMFGPLVCSLVNVITSAILMNILKIGSLSDAIQFGALIGFGYLTATTVNTAINPNIPRPLIYGLVSGSYFLISGIISSVILFFVTIQ